MGGGEYLRRVRRGRSGRRRGLGLVVVAAGLLVAACLADLPAPGTFTDGGGAEASVLDAARPAPRCGDGILQRDAGEACDPGDSGALGCDPVHCSIVCPGGFVGPTSDHCYFPLDGGKIASSAAIAACTAQGAHLVTYGGLNEQQLVDDHFGEAGGPYWLGLQLVTPVDVKPMYDVGTVNEPGWRSTCSGCYGPVLTAGAVEFVNLCKVLSPGCVAHGPNGPADFAVNCEGSCGDAGGIFADLLVHGLCEREPPGLSGQDCDDGGVCITLKSSASFYELVLTPLARPEAAAVCAGKNGHLVVFQTPEERAQLSAELVARTQPGTPQLEYWVGLSNPSTTSTPAWVWEDRTPVAGYPLEWGDGEPSPSTYPWAYGLVDRSVDDTSFDRQLLRAVTGDVTLPFVCEFDGRDGGAP